MRRCHSLIVLILLLIPVSFSPLQAQQLYRFDDRAGIPTLSKSLPPWAVHQGYDILDANSMRLLESVPPEPSEEMRARIRQQHADEARAARQAEQRAQETERLRRQQQRRDQTLRLTYESEDALIAARDNDLGHRQRALQSLLKKQDDLKQRLFDLQHTAADHQLKDQPVSEKLQQKLANARQQLMFNRNSVSTLQQQLEELKSKYAEHLKRYRQLHSAN